MKTKVNKSKRGLTALAVVAAVAVVLILRLGYIQLIKGSYYSAKAQSQQLSDSEVAASRGKIYDANMNVLAQSASVWKIYLNPSRINDIKKEELREEAKSVIASGLSAILGVDEEKILEYTEKNYKYQLVKGGVEKEARDSVYALIEKYASRDKDPIDLSGIIGIDPDVKRYYPYSSLASTVIGFTGSDGDGRAGIEYYYDDDLKGVPGRTITAVKGNGSEMPNQYETIYEAQEGNSLVLTIDMYMQYILEDVLSDAITSSKAENAYGIVMDVDTGAILAMVSLPDYDLNNPNELKYESLNNSYEIASQEAAEAETLTENEAYLASKAYFRNLQWSNRAITSTYEPGSVFKVITASAAIEEGVADINTPYFCSGTINFATRNIHCWKEAGHGSETFADFLKNSCNPFAVTLASNVGKDVYYDYFEAFGFTEKTGVDTAGDFTPTENVLFMSRKNMSKSDLASYSFGQSFQVSPLQMITAISAVANGGKLMTPYLVSKQIDNMGNTVKETEPTVRRQVISEATAKTICSCMEEVVATGTGKNAYVAGYHVAGKTGTSEKLVDNKESETKAYIASFCGFAPANDPEIAVIIVVDEPKGEHGGGAVAAPLAGEVLEQVLTYMGVERSYTDKEMALLVETAPSLSGKSVADARAEVASLNLSVKVIGDGETVVAQYPDAGREIPSDGIIVIYTQKENVSEKVKVPDFTGCSVSQANKLAINSGLNIKISGSSLSSGTVYAYKQSAAVGEEVNMGEIITVSFKTNVDVSD